MTPDIQVLEHFCASPFTFQNISGLGLTANREKEKEMGKDWVWYIEILSLRVLQTICNYK